VVFARADSPVQELGDIKGKKFMCVKLTSFGGCQMALRLFLDSGIDPKKDFAALLEGNTHDNVVLAVKNGAADAGTVRSDTLECMQDEGKIQMSDFRVIHPVKDDFPFVHSTVLYPEWPMAATAKTDEALRQKLADALIAMPADLPAAKIAGWTKPADYASVDDVVKTLSEKYGIKASD
jgi:two-component system sensor histidine kinase TtrS